MSQDDSLNWFHGKISRDRAEQLLREEGAKHADDGIFLVRESNTANGDYVLSVLHRKEIWHYQIRRHGEDCFFSIDEQAPIHGLDALIEHYQESSTGLVTQLTAIVKQDPPPNDTRRHGKTNLLHRATKQGDITVVTELLKSGYRNLDAKDQDGRTAIHLACMYKVDPKILQLLIENGATVNGRDIKGNTPLHYATKQNEQEKVILLLKANADCQSRNNETGWVALHEAANNGNLEMCKILLEASAPSMPRDSNGEFPSDFATQNGFLSLAEYLNSYEPTLTTFRDKWDHGTLDRIEAKKILRDYAINLYKEIRSVNAEDIEENFYENENKDRDIVTSGVFLVRISHRHDSNYIITLLFENESKNYVVRRDRKFYYIDEGPYMLSLEHLIQHYQKFPDGLPINLKYNVPPMPKPPLPLPTRPKVIKPMLPTPPVERVVEVPPRRGSVPVKEKEKPFTWLKLPSSLPRKKTPPERPIEFKPPIKPLENKLIEIEFESPIENPYDLPSIGNPRRCTEFSEDECHEENIYEVPNLELFIQSDESKYPNYFPDGNKNVEEIYFVDAPTISVASSTKNRDLYDDQGNFLNREATLNYYVDNSNLTLETELGQGEFGAVYKGKLVTVDGSIVDVAVKQLNDKSENCFEFLRESSVMIKLQHKCIVSIIGIAKGPPLKMVQELCKEGALIDYLQDNRDKIRGDIQLKVWAAQIADGMHFLEKNRFVHRDLAARNILLASVEQAKIADFGLSRAVGAGENYYKAKTGGKWPIKWYAPESFNFGTFSHASDVWSFGVLLWEMYSLGQVPYGEDTSGNEVIAIIEEKRARLQRPALCPKNVYNTMRACWQKEPRNRPCFRYLADFFSKLQKSTYENLPSKRLAK